MTTDQPAGYVWSVRTHHACGRVVMQEDSTGERFWCPTCARVVTESEVNEYRIAGDATRDAS